MGLISDKIKEIESLYKENKYNKIYSDWRYIYEDLLDVLVHMYFKKSEKCLYDISFNKERHFFYNVATGNYIIKGIKNKKPTLEQRDFMLRVLDSVKCATWME